MDLSRVVPVAGVVALALAAAAAAQERPRAARPSPTESRPAAASEPAARPAEQAPATAERQPGGGTARYLAEHPQVLNLTAVQQARIRKLAAHEDSANAPLRGRMHELTRGQQVRAMPPAERRRVAPQLRDVMRQMRANDEAELDSVSAILTPEQATRLETLREDFKQRREARQAAPQQRADTARARAGGRPPRP